MSGVQKSLLYIQDGVQSIYLYPVVFINLGGVLHSLFKNCST